MHNYLKVPDVRRCQITGLQGCHFIDKTRDNNMYQVMKHDKSIRIVNVTP